MSKYTTTLYWRQKDQLERAYWDYYWSSQQIAKWLQSFGQTTSNTAIRAELDRHDIPVRSQQIGMMVRKLKDDGASLEVISSRFPDPRINRDIESETDELTWSDIQ